MTRRVSHLGAQGVRTMSRRLRDVGLLLLECDGTGQLVSRPSVGRDWMADLFCQAPMFIVALRQAVD